MSMAFLSTPLVVFIIFVVPLWLWLHYRNKRSQDQNMGNEGVEKLHELTQRANHLQHRIDTLERLLDIEAPRWRHK